MPFSTANGLNSILYQRGPCPLRNNVPLRAHHWDIEGRGGGVGVWAAGGVSQVESPISSTALMRLLRSDIRGFQIFTLGALEWPWGSTGHHTPLRAQLSSIHPYSEDRGPANKENHSKWEFRLCLAESEICQMFSGWGMLPCAEFEVCANNTLNVN